MSDITTRVCRIVADAFAFETEFPGVIPGWHLADDLGFDDIDLVEIVWSCESAFGVSIDDSTIDRLTTVQSLIEAVVTARAA